MKLLTEAIDRNSNTLLEQIKELAEPKVTAFIWCIIANTQMYYVFAHMVTFKAIQKEIARMYEQRRKASW